MPMTGVDIAPASPTAASRPSATPISTRSSSSAASDETEIVAANLLASRLTLLYGPSGVGKTSLLRAGVARSAPGRGRTRRRPWPSTAPGPPTPWPRGGGAGRRPPRTAVPRPTRRGPPTAPPPGPPSSAARSASSSTSSKSCSCTTPTSTGRAELADQLPELVQRATTRVNVLLLREDALAQLDAFKRRIPGLFANSLRLDHLDREAARAAVLGPLERYNVLAARPMHVAIEPELVEAVLDEVAAGRIEPGAAGSRRGHERCASRRVETPYLQLVLQRVWEVERERGSHRFASRPSVTWAGPKRIVEHHLERAPAAWTPSQQDAAATAFGHLVTPSGTKIAHGRSDSAMYASPPSRNSSDVAAPGARTRPPSRR